MDRLETLLSDTLADRACDAPTGPVPLVNRSRRLPLVVAVAAACVLVAAVAAVFAVRGSGPAPSLTPQAQPPFQPQVPAGSRLASYGPLWLFVPSGLATATSYCDAPMAQAVVALDGAARFCEHIPGPIASHPGIVVWLSDARHTPYATIPTSPTHIDGHPALRGYTTSNPALGDGVAGVAQLTDVHITIGVTAPTRADVDKVLDTIHIGQANPLGCAPTLAAATVTRPGPSTTLIPGDPNLAVRCEYGTNPGAADLLVGSYLLDTTGTDQLVTALNELRPDPCHCVHGGTSAPGHADVLYLHYRDQATLRITGSIGANLDSYNNGARTVVNFSSTVDQLLAHLTNQH